jgi:hypothetical protein
MDVSDQIHIPAITLRETSPNAPCTWGEVGPIAGLHIVEKSKICWPC